MNKKQKRQQRRARKRKLKSPHFIVTQTCAEDGRKFIFVQSSTLVGLLNGVKLTV